VKRTVRWVSIVILMACAMFLTLCVVLLLLIDDERDRSTNTYSHSFADHSEKVAFLRQYVNAFSPIIDTEYHIQYHDNGPGLPGPSDWNMNVVVKIAPEHIALWTSGMLKVDLAQCEMPWAQALIADSLLWQLTSQPDCYHRGAGVSMLLYSQEGILFKHMRSLP